jgi:hypothetical protein
VRVGVIRGLTARVFHLGWPWWPASAIGMAGLLFRAERRGNLELVLVSSAVCSAVVVVSMVIRNRAVSNTVGTICEVRFIGGLGNAVSRMGLSRYAALRARGDIGLLLEDDEVSVELRGQGVVALEVTKRGAIVRGQLDTAEGSQYFTALGHLRRLSAGRG